MISCNAGTAPSRKQAIIEELEEHGVLLEALAEEVGKDFDPFDLICHIAYDQPPLTRRERAENVNKRNYFTKYGEQARAVLEALLDKYADEGIDDHREASNVLKVQPFDQSRHPDGNHQRRFGGKEQYLRGRCRSWNSSSTLLHKQKTDRMSNVSTHHQIHPGHHAQGRRRRRRRPAHQPAGLDVLPQDLRRPGAGTRAARGRLHVADSRSTALAQLGRRPRGHDRRRRCSTSSTTSCSPSSRNCHVGPTATTARLRRPQRLRRRLQLHEVRHPDAPGDQQDQRDRLQQHRRPPHSSATSTSRSSKTCRAPATPASTTPPAPSPSSWSTWSTPSSARTVLDPACGTGGFLTCTIEHMRKHYVKTAEDEEHAAAVHPRRREEAPAAPALHHQHDAARHRRAHPDPPRQHPGPPLRDYGPKDRVDVIVTNPPFGGMEEDGIETNFPPPSAPARPPTCSWC